MLEKNKAIHIPTKEFRNYKTDSGHLRLQLSAAQSEVPRT